MFHLHSQGVQIQVAPYTAAAHLAYLERIDKVDGVQGSASCLLYGCDRIILDFDWAKKEVCWTSLPKCLTKLDLTRDQFVTVCLISGSSILPTLPELDREDVKPKIVMATRLLNTFNNDIDAVLRPKENDYHKEYYRALHALKHPIQLEVTGHVRPKDGEKEGTPNDFHEFIGRRLPAELYEYMCRGLVGSRILNSRARGEILETPPLDGGLSPTYKDLVSTKLKPIRAQTIGLMTTMIHRYYQKNDIQVVCWFNEPSSTSLGITDRTDWQKDADTWHAKAEQRPKVDSSEILGSGLMWSVLSLAKDTDAKKTLTPRQKDAPPPLADFEDVRSNIIWRFLQDRGYTKSDHTLSAWGKVLKAAFERAASDGRMATQETKTEMEDIIFLAIELIRLDVLGTQQMFPAPPYSGGLTRGTDKDKSNAMLVSRVACLGTVEHDKIGYTGPLSRNLLAYHQMTAAVRGALRDLIEAHAGYIFCSGSVQRVWNNPMYTDLAASLPFVNEPDLGLGIVVKSYLDELSSPKPAQIEAWFHHVHDIDGNLKKAWTMWDAVCQSTFRLDPERTQLIEITDQRRSTGRRQQHRELRHQDDIQKRRYMAEEQARAQPNPCERTQWLCLGRSMSPNPHRIDREPDSDRQAVHAAIQACARFRRRGIDCRKRAYHRRICRTPAGERERLRMAAFSHRRHYEAAYERSRRRSHDAWF